MNHPLNHEVTLVVNGESRRVVAEAPQEPKTKPAAKPAAAKKPGLLERAKAAVTGKSKKA